MIKGSNGVGGRRYQIAAVLLTYAAVSMAAIPVWISYARQHPTKSAQHQRANSNPDAGSGDQNSSLSSDSNSSESGSNSSSSGSQQRPTLGAWLIKIAFLGLASPFLELQDGLGGIIGLIILAVGMRFAWRITAGRPLQIFGPFDSAPQPTR
jgi:hypothetical protein